MSDEVTPPPVEEAAPPIEAAPEPEAQAEPEPDSFEVPEEGRYVPLAALQAERGKARDLKAKADRADQLEQELTSTKAKQQESAPIIEAARAIVEAAQRQAQPPPQPVVEDTTELQEIARDFDLWKPDGTPDLDRAKRIQAREQSNARRIAQETTAPMVVESLQNKARYNLARAKNTTWPDGSKPDPQILEAMWGEMGKTAQGLHLLANEQQATHLLEVAYARTAAAGKAAPPITAKVEAPPPPLYTETAGGKDAGLPKLTAADKRAAKDNDMSEAEYAKTLAGMPAGWGKSR